MRLPRLSCAILLSVALRGQSPAPNCLLERALKLHQAGDFPEAVREYQVCVAAEPGRAEVRSNLGAALVRLGRYQEAIEQYQAALKTAPPQIVQQLRLNLALA